MEIRPEAQDPSTFPPPPLLASRPPAISVNPHHQIRFRHPHYPDSSNVLLTLLAPDSPAGGIEYGFAHAACGVVSGNRWNGWFTTTVDGAPLTLTYGDTLCNRDYYFHLPESSLESPYAIVPTFREWTFPHENLHPCWQTHHDHVALAQSRLAAPSSLSAAVLSRDQSCRMSGFAEGTQAAHLCPRSEEAWFQRNSMSRYNLNPLLVATGPTEDTANALLLRQDLHTHFDAHKFLFVPKKRADGEEMPIVTHLLIPSRELGIIHHNMRLKPIPDVDMAFLFSRFAWSIFNLIAGFLKVGVERRLIGTTISSPSGLPQTLDAVTCTRLAPGPKSRSQSPTKRQRRSDAEIGDDVEERGRFHKRQRRSDAHINDEVESERLHNRQKRTSDAEVDDVDQSGRLHKRQKKNDITVDISHEASQSTKVSEDISTPTASEEDIDILRDAWLRKERARSDVNDTWLEEEKWACHIRDEDQVMGPADAIRLYKFLGHEERDVEDEIGKEEN